MSTSIRIATIDFSNLKIYAFTKIAAVSALVVAKSRVAAKNYYVQIVRTLGFIAQS